MNVLSIFEQRISAIFEEDAPGQRKPFSFKRLAKRAVREMEDETFVIDGVDTAPALYTVLVSATDDELMRPMYARICDEVSQLVEAQAKKRGYTFVGRPLVRFMVDPALRRGKFSVFAENIDPRTLARLREEENAYLGITAPKKIPFGQNFVPEPVPLTEEEPTPIASEVGFVSARSEAPAEELDAPVIEEFDAPEPEVEELDVPEVEEEYLEEEAFEENEFFEEKPFEEHIEEPLEEEIVEEPFDDMHDEGPIDPEPMVDENEWFDEEDAQVPEAEEFDDIEDEPQQDDAVADLAEEDFEAEDLTAPDTDTAPAPSDEDAEQPQEADDIEDEQPIEDVRPIEDKQPIEAPASRGVHYKPAAASDPAAQREPEPVAEPEHPTRVIPSRQQHDTCTLTDTATGRTYQVIVRRTPIGRERMEGGIVLRDPNVSRRHAELVFENGVWLIRDLDSTNGTLVDDMDVHEAILADGDIITIGLTNLEFKAG